MFAVLCCLHNLVVPVSGNFWCKKHKLLYAFEDPELQTPRTAVLYVAYAVSHTITRVWPAYWEQLYLFFSISPDFKDVRQNRVARLAGVLTNKTQVRRSQLTWVFADCVNSVLVCDLW